MSRRGEWSGANLPNLAKRYQTVTTILPLTGFWLFWFSGSNCGSLNCSSTQGRTTSDWCWWLVEWYYCRWLGGHDDDGVCGSREGGDWLAGDDSLAIVLFTLAMHNNQSHLVHTQNTIFQVQHTDNDTFSIQPPILHNSLHNRKDIERYPICKRYSGLENHTPDL